MENQQPVDEVQASQKKEWHRNWWGILIIILFLPFFAIWYVWAKTNWNKTIKSVITVIILFVFFSIGVENSEPIKENNIETESNKNKQDEQLQTVEKPIETAQESSKDAEISEQPASVKTIAFKELTSYEKSGSTWRNIVISPEASQEDLVMLAKELHTKDPQSYFHIFDDDAEFQEYMDWDINYGKVKDKDGKVKQIDQCLNIAYCRTLIQQGKYAFPFPEAWGNKHEIAIINKMLNTNNMDSKWKLSDPFGVEISNL